MSQLIEVSIYCPSKETAEAIAASLLEKRLAACANISGPVSSSYFWKGQVETANEHVLLLKTTAKCFDAITAEARGLHPDEVPCIIARNIDAAAHDFRQWVLDNVKF